MEKYNKLPKKAEFAGHQLDVTWKSLKKMRDKWDNLVEVYVPIPKAEYMTLITNSDFTKNIMAKTDTGYIRLTPNEVKEGCHLEFSDILPTVTAHNLKTELTRQNLFVSDDDILATAEKLGSKLHLFKDTLKTLGEDALEIKEPAPDDSGDEGVNEPLTKESLKQILQENEELKEKPWLQKPIRNLNDGELAKMEGYLKDCYLQRVSPRLKADQPEQLKPEVARESPFEETEVFPTEDIDSTLFGSDIHKKKSVDEMTDLEFQTHEAELRQAAAKGVK